jgi:hypothetical protein
VLINLLDVGVAIRGKARGTAERAIKRETGRYIVANENKEVRAMEGVWRCCGVAIHKKVFTAGVRMAAKPCSDLSVFRFRGLMSRMTCIMSCFRQIPPNTMLYMYPFSHELLS